mmetsp:Transcript_23950/g.33070  ORF Transcript_23950/g.33070 Transcript_23950/m.33070 type:complete len:212 (+) Transcript_23950:95-730(+)
MAIYSKLTPQRLLVAFVSIVWFSTASKSTKFRAANRMSRTVASFADPAKFEIWFQQPSTAQTILDLNPALVKVEKISEKQYKGFLAPLQFPGVSVTSVVDFEVTSDPSNSSVAICCDASSVSQIVEGNKFFADILSKLTPAIKSSSVYTFDQKSGKLTNSIDLAICFDLPNWFPIPNAVVEESGSRLISNQNEKDFDDMFSGLKAMYVASQ